MLGEDERKKLAKTVVDAAISIYTIGMMKECYAPVEVINQWVPALAGFFPSLATSPLSWEDRHRAIAKLLYEVGLRLGGLAFKAMQFVGLRDDLPDGYKQWFSKAQENTDFFSSEDHVKRVLGEFAPRLKWSFEPVKSASIAQVHLNASWDGRPAIAKVQHAHVKAEYAGDLKTMAELGRYVNKYPEATGAAVMLEALALKLAPTVDMETDFNRERVNQERARELFRTHDTDVVVAEAVLFCTLLADLLVLSQYLLQLAPYAFEAVVLCWCGAQRFTRPHRKVWSWRSWRESQLRRPLPAGSREVRTTSSDGSSETPSTVPLRTWC